MDTRLQLLKNSSLKVAANLARIPSERQHAIRQANCGTWLKYAVTPGTLEMMLNKANWCKLRSCPICNWIRAIKRRVKVFAGLSNLRQYNPYLRFAFLTLTVKNCHQSELRSTAMSMEKGWLKFCKRQGFPAIGFIKSLEVTRPKDCFYAGHYLGRFGAKLIKSWKSQLQQTDLWNESLWKEYFCEECHPHFHALLVLPQSYRPDSPTWLNQSQWTDRWGSAMNLNYKPVVDIRSCYAKGEDKLGSAVFEATKYVLKPLDMLDPLAPFIFRQLHGLKLNSVGGILRSYVNQDVLDQINNQMTSGSEYHQSGVPLEYKWSGEDGQYWISRIADVFYQV